MQPGWAAQELAVVKPMANKAGLAPITFSVVRIIHAIAKIIQCGVESIQPMDVNSLAVFILIDSTIAENSRPLAPIIEKSNIFYGREKMNGKEILLSLIVLSNDDLKSIHIQRGIYILQLTDSNIIEGDHYRFLRKKHILYSPHIFSREVYRDLRALVENADVNLKQYGRARYYAATAAGHRRVSKAIMENPAIAARLRNLTEFLLNISTTTLLKIASSANEDLASRSDNERRYD